MLTRLPLYLAPDDTTTPDTSTSSSTNAGGGGTGGVQLEKAEYEALITARSRAAELEAQNKALLAQTEETAILFKKDADPAKREAAVRKNLAANGYTRDEIDAYFAAQAEPEEIDNEPPQKKKAPDASELEQLRKEVAELKGVHSDNRRKNLEANLTNEIDSALQEQEAFVKQLTKLSGEGDEGKKLVESVVPDIRQEVRDATLRAIQTKAQKNGIRPSEAWIAEAAREAAKAVTTKYSRLIVHASRMGRNDDSADIQQFLESKPVPMPKWAKGKTTDQLDRDMAPAVTDKLLRSITQDSVL